MTDQDFDLAVSKAHLEAAGWNLDDFFQSNPFQCHVLYVRDFRTDHIQLFSIKREDFESTSAPFSATELSGAIAPLMQRLAAGELAEKELQVLPQVLVSYVKATQSFRQWKSEAGPDSRLHAILNIYPGGAVRPFIARTTATVIPADKLIDDTDKVRQMDLVNHPEWFS